MPLEFQTVEIQLSAGLDQKIDERYTVEGKLTTADNVVFDKLGALNKRRGYKAVEVGTELFGATVDPYLMHLALHEDELLVIGAENLYSCADPDDELPGTRGLVIRGPIPRGNIRRQDVATSHTGDDTGIIPG